MELTLQAYQVTDSQGNKWVDVTSDVNNDIFVYGIRNEENNLLHFESEAYHLKRWCEENNLIYKHQEVQITITFK